MLLNKGKITKEMIAMLSTWRHSGFHVFCGNRISPDEETAKYPLTSKNSPPILRPLGSNSLSNAGKRRWIC
jgi:hypothetical protein